MKENPLFMLIRIIEDYANVKKPKYRNADFDALKRDYAQLMEMKEFLKSNHQYAKIVNAISQTITKMNPKNNEWISVSERSINKAIPPVARKRNQTAQFPFEWIDKDSGEKCFINNGYWGAKNYMVMDIIGYYLLLKEGGDRLPQKPAPIFNDIKSITMSRSNIPDNNADMQGQSMMNSKDIQRIENTRFWINFNDKDFRKSTSLDMSSNDIKDLILETSRVEFKLVFPVRIMSKGKEIEQSYSMNVFSRLFEFGYIDKDIRKDGIVRNREYRISFNTALGELFVHNLLSKSYDWLDNKFYRLPYNAQYFYRRFLLHNDFKSIPFKIETIRDDLNLQDSNITNLTGTIETNILQPLIDHGFIDDYIKNEGGLYGLKFTIKRSKKGKPHEKNEKTIDLKVGNGGLVKNQ